jgi:WD40 repeat protein
MLKKMEGHRHRVWRLAVPWDGRLVASGDKGKVIIWHRETGELLTKIEAHSNWISSLDFSPDGTVLATSSYFETTTKLWRTKTWELQGDPIVHVDSCICQMCMVLLIFTGVNKCDETNLRHVQQLLKMLGTGND